MKSLNAKISAIIICGFLLQIILIGSLYRLVISKQILTSVNAHENARQEILEGAVLKIEKSSSNLPAIQNTLEDYSKKYDISFQLNDRDGNTIMTVDESKGSPKRLQEMSFIKFKGKPTYILYAKYPLKLKSLPKNLAGQNYRLYFALVIILTSLVISLLIYGVFTLPVKKLRRAVDSMNYGNTIVRIPYDGDDEIGELCRKFEDMGERLKKSEDTQMEILQAISHDIKTPLTSIIGYAERLRDGRVSSQEKLHEYHDIIFRKANDVKGLLEELDEYSSLNREGKFEKTIVNAAEYFNGICSEFQSEISRLSGEINCVNQIDKGININIDGSKIKRVFWNIIENSIKYGGDNLRISISSEKKGSFVRFSICDGGPGVPEDQLQRMFDRFYRIDSSRSREKGGTGLGLSICKGIVEGHGGRIWAKNSSSGGLCIEFEIPVIG